MAEKTVATPEAQKANMTESTRNQERYVAPPVDIYETRDGLVVLADLPGVAKEALDVRVDNNMLTIRGHELETRIGRALIAGNVREGATIRVDVREDALTTAIENPQPEAVGALA